MLLLRPELWAERSGILFGTQFDFRKERIRERRTFLDLTGAYENVSIDILCRELKKERSPIPLVFLL
jgi:hypothetical protein